MVDKVEYIGCILTRFSVPMR